MSQPEQVSPLRIGFLGYTGNKTMYGFHHFAEENREDIRLFKKDKIVFTDGTIVFPLSNARNIIGQKFDQLILFGGDLEISRIKKTIQELGCRSCVPEECIIMQYD